MSAVPRWTLTWHGTVLHVTFAGDWSASSGYAMFRDVAAACAGRPASGVLIDGRDATGRLHLPDRVKLVLRVAPLRLRVPIAMVGPASLVHARRLGQFLARRLGMTLVVFTEYSDAFAWLVSRGSMRPPPGDERRRGARGSATRPD